MGSSNKDKGASSRESIRERRRKKQRKRRLTVLLSIVAVAILLVVVAFAPALWETLAPVGEVVIPDTGPRPMADFNAMGDPDAPVTIIEFSDFQCPYCVQFNIETEPSIVEQYVATGDVYFVYRSMGNFISDNLRRGGTESRDAAEAAYCAGDQGMFWEYKDTLYANVKGEGVGSFSEKRLIAYADALNLDMDQFRSCLEDQKYRSMVAQDGIDGNAAGVTGTPAFLINGKLVTGAQPFSAFQREIEALLAVSGN